MHALVWCAGRDGRFTLKVTSKRECSVNPWLGQGEKIKRMRKEEEGEREEGKEVCIAGDNIVQWCVYGLGTSTQFL